MIDMYSLKQCKSLLLSIDYFHGKKKSLLNHLRIVFLSTSKKKQNLKKRRKWNKPWRHKIMGNFQMVMKV